MAYALRRLFVAAVIVGCGRGPDPVTQPKAEAPSQLCLSMRDRRASAKSLLAAGRLRASDAYLACADKRCPSEASSSADVRRKTFEALGRHRKADLGAALASSTDPEVAADMLARLGVGPSRKRNVTVAANGTVAVSNGRVVLDGEINSEQREVLFYDPTSFSPRYAVPAKTWQLSPDGLVLATTDATHVSLHDPAAGTSVKFPIGDLTFAPDSQRVAIVTDASISIVGLVKKTVDATFSAKGRPTVRFAGKVVVLHNEAGDLSVVEVGTGKTVFSRTAVLDADISEDDKRLAWAATVDGAVDLAFVDLATFATVQTARAAFPKSAVAPKVAIADDGHALAISDGQTLVAMDGKTGKTRKLPSRGSELGVTSLYFDREGRRVCGVFVREGEACGWDLTTNTAILNNPLRATFVSRRRAVEIKTRGLGAPSLAATVLRNVSSGSSRVSNGALTEDGRTFAVVEQEGKFLYVVLYDVLHKKVLARLPLGGDPVEYVSMLRVELVADVFFVQIDARAMIADPKRRTVLVTFEDAVGAPVVVSDTLVIAAARGGAITFDRKTGVKKTWMLNQALEACAIGPHLLDKRACEELVDCP